MSENSGRTIHTKIVGVTFEDRQSVIKNLEKDSELLLIREPSNPKDRNAIAVYWGSKKLGYLSREEAAQYASGLDHSKITSLPAIITAITGSEETNLGVNIRFQLPDKASKKVLSSWAVGARFGLGMTISFHLLRIPFAGLALLFNEWAIGISLIFFILLTFLIFTLIGTAVTAYKRSVSASVFWLTILLLVVIVAGYITNRKQPQPQAYNTAVSNNSTTSTKATPTTNYIKGCVIPSTLKVRSGPGQAYNTIGTLKKGDCFEVLGKSEDSLWYRITMGWVYASHMQTGTREVTKIIHSTEPTAEKPRNSSEFSARLSIPLEGELVISSNESMDQEWREWIEGHARNLAIPEPYEWEMIDFPSGTKHKNVEAQYRNALVKLRGYRQTFGELGTNNIYLMKFKKDDTVVTIHFWEETKDEKPAALIIYQNWSPSD